MLKKTYSEQDLMIMFQKCYEGLMNKFNSKLYSDLVDFYFYLILTNNPPLIKFFYQTASSIIDHDVRRIVSKQTRLCVLFEKLNEYHNNMKWLYLSSYKLSEYLKGRKLDIPTMEQLFNKQITESLFVKCADNLRIMIESLDYSMIQSIKICKSHQYNFQRHLDNGFCSEELDSEVMITIQRSVHPLMMEVLSPTMVRFMHTLDAGAEYLYPLMEVFFDTLDLDNVQNIVSIMITLDMPHINEDIKNIVAKTISEKYNDYVLNVNFFQLDDLYCWGLVAKIVPNIMKQITESYIIHIHTLLHELEVDHLMIWWYSLSRILNNKILTNEPIFNHELDKLVSKSVSEKDIPVMINMVHKAVLSDAQDRWIMELISFCYNFAPDRELFRLSYQHKLSHRLLNKPNYDRELCLINHLTTLAGRHYTSLMNVMIKDLITHVPHSVDNLTMTVISSCWKTPSINYDLPSEIVPVELYNKLTEFKHHYDKMFSGRTLKLVKSMCKVHILAKLKKTYLFEMGLLQYHIITSLEEGIISFPPDYQDTIDGLIKAKIITSDMKINYLYNNKMTKISLFKLQSYRQKHIEEKLKSDSLLEHHVIIESAIVKIMKMKQTLDHQQLFLEVFEMTKDRFVLQQVDLKKVIDSLIDREYISRSTNMNVYQYIC
jgi:hypothetical protein